MAFIQKEHYDISDLLAIMEFLRAPDGCPWDRVQTHESIRRNMIEEAYEVVDAIDQNDLEGMKEELGDVLMQVVFHARIEEEKGNFNFDEVTDGVCKKLVFRHPHVFACEKADDDRGAIISWEAQKKVEKAQKTQADSMRSVPQMMPALIRGSKLQEKAARSGMDWKNELQALTDAEQALHAVRCAAENKDQKALNAAIGRLLFDVVGTARLCEVEPEAALTHTSNAFLNAFAAYEESKCDMKQKTPDQLLENA